MRCLHYSRKGFTLIELLLAVVITGVGICAALSGIQLGIGSSHLLADSEIARHYADSFRQFSRDLAIRDPQGGALFGPEETSLAEFDDIDDLDGLQISPVDGSGAPLPGAGDWTLRSTVVSIDPSTLEPIEDAGSTPLKQVRVEVFKKDSRMGYYSWLAAER